MPSFDILVIGAGVIGSSVAYHLAKQGAQVLVVERAEIAVEPAASWASAGSVRRQGRDPAEAKLAVEAIERWRTLEEELGADLQYRRGGNLLLAENEEEAAQLKDFVREQQEHGFHDVVFVDRKQALSIVPGLNDMVLAGSYSPADGQADPALTTRAFAAAAQRHGATYWTNTVCRTLLTQGERIIGADTGRGEVRAGTVVLAAGAWSLDLARAIGIELAVKVVAFQMIRSTTSVPGRLQPVVSAIGRLLSLKQLNTGAFLLGGGWVGELTQDGRSYKLLPQQIQGNWQTACELLPEVGLQKIEQAWCGLEAQSVDELPLIGPLPERTGVFLALGFSGHGFAISPAVGRAVADCLAGRATPELDGLWAERSGL